MNRLILVVLLSYFVCSGNCMRRPSHSGPPNSPANRDYMNKITFYLFKNDSTSPEISTFDRDLSSHGCDVERGNFSMIVHGWKESFEGTEWVMDTITNLTNLRGGCLIFMDYSNFSIVPNYFQLTPHFQPITEVLLRKIMQINSHDRLFLFGFSFGARLCFEAGSRLGSPPKIARIDACDPAGVGFDGSPAAADPKSAAKNVQCINTSIDKGTSIYNCHQNFRMGRCGVIQPGSTVYPKKHHGLCPYYYNSAFKNDFYPSRDNECRSRREPANYPSNLRMGFLGAMTDPMAYGDFFVPTSNTAPWHVNVNAIYKQSNDE